METLEEEEEEDADDRLSQKANITYPEEITEQILSRLPVKSILRFKSVSKPWRSLISAPSFHKLHSTPPLAPAPPPCSSPLTMHPLAHDTCGSVAHLITKLDNTHLDTCYAIYRAQHLNGLVCFPSRTGTSSRSAVSAYVINPTTRKFFKLPHPLLPLTHNLFGFDVPVTNCAYLFGFHELRNEHKVLYFDIGCKVMIFSISNYSWRKIDVVGVSPDRWFYATGGSICVNNTIYLMLEKPLEILAINLTTEMSSIVEMPEAILNSLYPFVRFVKINGLIGVVCHDPLDEGNKLNNWVLQDYENRVWVRETVTFPPESQIYYGEDGPFPFDSTNTGDIIFSPRLLSEDLISVPVYNMKTRCFKSIGLTLGHRFLSPELVNVELIKCYVESLIPLQN